MKDIISDLLQTKRNFILNEKKWNQRISKMFKKRFLVF